jgi:hypothetical protein
MKVFEFHFNPKAQSDLIFESFCYDPENIYEKRLGNIYMVGFLTNALPQNVRFLNNLAKVIKDKYYKNASAKPERALRETLRRANEHLEKIAKEGDVTWLGNFNFAVAAFKNFELNFTKVGDLKIYLLRKGQIIDIDQKLRFEEIEPYPLKIFGNIVSGKLAENDIVLVLTKEIADSFLKENLLTKIAQTPLSESAKNVAKKIRDILNAKKEQLLETKGICLLIYLTKETSAKERETLAQSKTWGVFSFKKVLLPFIKKIRFPKIRFQKPTLKIPRIRLNIPKIKTYKPNLNLPELSFKTFFSNRKAVLVVFFILILILGFFIFQKQEEKRIINYQNQLNDIKEKVNRAENYLMLGGKNSQAEKNANSLFTESWEEISPIFNIISSFPSDFEIQVSDLKNKISQNLSQLNKMTEIAEPRLFFEFKARDFIPQKMVSLEENLYFFTPYGENVFTVNQKGEGKILPVKKKISLASPVSNSVLFFIRPDQINNLTDEQFREPVSLETPYPEFNFSDFSNYQSNLYFLDNKNGRVVKYPYLGEFQWGFPQTWLENQKAKDFKSMAVDGSVWFLSKNNSIEKYYAGNLQKTFNLKIFPEPKEFSRILTSSQLPYLYVLEPTQKRIIILTKSGQLVKQFQSQKFDNLLDFSVSTDGKKIWLLNGLKVFQINP